MYAWSARVVKVIEPFWTDDSATVPQAAYVEPVDNLRETPGLDVTNFNEGRGEEDDVGRVPRGVSCDAFPFDDRR